MIIHLTHTFGGGTQKYVDDLIKLFPNEEHQVINQTPFSIRYVDKIKLVHIHATMFGDHIGWNVLGLIDALHEKSIPVYLTVHDYQWLFTENPAPTTEDFATITPKEVDLQNCKQLIEKVDKILIPSRRLYDNYKRYLENMPDSKIFVVPHCDIPLRFEQSYIPQMTSTINVAFVGTPLLHKGIKQFYQLSQAMPRYFDTPIMYNIYGGHNIIQKSNIIEHGKYDDNVLVDMLHQDNIHIVLSISTAEETYCYSLSQLINTGLPIVYLNRGALLTRLPEAPRFFPINDLSMLSLQQAVVDAIRYVGNNKTDDYTEMSKDVQLNEYYRSNYLPV